MFSRGQLYTLDYYLNKIIDKKDNGRIKQYVFIDETVIDL